MRNKRVYIAAPYTRPDPAQNVGRAIEAAEEILQRTTDWLPLVPHLNHLWHLICPHPYIFWMTLDADWMRACHALVRLEGDSPGADSDMGLAVELGIPVFLNLDEFIKWTKEG